VIAHAKPAFKSSTSCRRKLYLGNQCEIGMEGMRTSTTVVAHCLSLSQHVGRIVTPWRSFLRYCSASWFTVESVEDKRLAGSFSWACLQSEIDNAKEGLAGH